MTDTDDAYLVIDMACSLISGHYYVTNRIINYSKVAPTPNDPILPEFKTLKTVVSYSSEAEICGTFGNSTNVIPLRNILETFYLHRQPTKFSPIATDNLTYQGILTHFIKPRKSNLGYEIPLVRRLYFSKKN